MSLREKFIKILNEYESVYAKVWSTQEFRNPLLDFFNTDLKQEVYSVVAKMNSALLVDSSTGVGRTTGTPWITIMDGRITSRASQGTYVVYLFNKDTKILYLALGRSSNEAAKIIEDKGYSGREKTAQIREYLKEEKQSLLEKLNVGSFSSLDDIDSGKKEFDQATIVYKKYALSEMPSDEELVQDLYEIIGIYAEYTDWYLTKNSQVKMTEHSIGTYDSWEILNENVAVKTCDTSFFNHHGSGVPIAIRWFWDAEELNNEGRRDFQISYNGDSYSAHVEKESSQNGRTRIFWSTDLAKELQKLEKKPECKAFYTKQSSDIYVLEIKWREEEGEEQLSTKETLDQIKKYIVAKGFTFDEGLVENYYLSLKSKPFVILAGTSGTGKTRLVRLFAEAIGATSQNGRYKLVSVRPDWSDSSDLFGHVNLNDKFIPGAIIDFVKQAELDSRNPYFLCLDEMNLARVEYYLSDILSIIETRECVDGKVTTDPLISENYYGADTSARGKYGVVRIPENLYIIGTVNMDETTFPFSRKVLDRANTIEFSAAELLANFDSSQGEAKSIYVDNSFMKAEYVFFNQCASEKDFVEEICIELQNINKILEKANAHVGYRVRDEIVFYMLNNKKADNLLSRDVAFDHEIMQKILPRIQGSKEAVKAGMKIIVLYNSIRINRANCPEKIRYIGKHISMIYRANDGALYWNYQAVKDAIYS